jgi:YceI-like domain
VSAAGDVTGTITMAARSVDIKNKRRDEHLRSADFFDVVNHPDITFTVDGIRPDNGGVRGRAASPSAAGPAQCRSMRRSPAPTARGRWMAS